jgi:hypothetical protein
VPSSGGVSPWDSPGGRAINAPSRGRDARRVNPTGHGGAPSTFAPIASAVNRAILLARTRACV